MPEQSVGLSSAQMSPDDLALLIEALDSHEYWQVGDVLPRNDGMVWIPGDSVDTVDRFWAGRKPTAVQAEAIEQVRRCRELADRLRAACDEA